MSTLSSNLERIKDAVDEIRENIGGETIEEVAENSNSVANLDDYFDPTTVSSWGGSTIGVGTWVGMIKTTPRVEYPASFGMLFYNYPGESIDMSAFEGKSVAGYRQTFASCKNLKELDLSKITFGMASNGFYSAFSGCSNLTDLNIGIDLSLVYGSRTNYDSFLYAFSGCSKLTNLTFGYNYGKEFGANSSYSNYSTKAEASLDFSSCQLLTHESLMSVINGLYDITSKGLSFTPDIKLHAAAYARLSPEEIAQATAKGWNIISA